MNIASVNRGKVLVMLLSNQAPDVIWQGHMGPEFGRCQHVLRYCSMCPVLLSFVVIPLLVLLLFVMVNVHGDLIDILASFVSHVDTDWPVMLFSKLNYLFWILRS